ncbi:MAG: hypothetical protein ACLQSR_16555 [Limisphaerales bacterium]
MAIIVITGILAFFKWRAKEGLNLQNSSKIKEKSKGDSQRDTHKLVSSRHALSLVVAAWPKLPFTLQTAILAIINSVAEAL